MIRYFLVVILFLAASLRFYNLSPYLQFLGDEGRDALVVKRIIVDHQLTLLGPTASVGGFYTGPIYYYFMLPFLWLWGLNPVGPAVMAGLFGLATIALIFFSAKEFFGEKAAVISAVLVAVSPKMIDISRFSWNPNPVPFFSLLTIFLLYLAAVRKKILYTFLSGISLGILVQLHYMDLIFIPIVGIALLFLFPRRQWLIQIALMSLGFFVGDSLFLVFELRHGFPNTKSVWEFINRHGATVAPRSSNLLWLFNDIARQLYEIVLGFRGSVLNLFYYFSLVGFIFWIIKSFRPNKNKIVAVVTWLVIGVLGVGFYRGTLFDHYFNTLYPLPFLLLGLSGELLWKHEFLRFLVPILTAVLIFFQVPKLFFWSPPNNLLAQTQAVDQIVIDLAAGEPYNFALIAPGNSDHAYRYFLEIWGKKPVVIDPPQSDPNRQTVTGQLIVVCESNCAPLGDPTWEVAGFGRAEIIAEKVGPAGIKVYKLINYQQS